MDSLKQFLEDTVPLAAPQPARACNNDGSDCESAGEAPQKQPPMDSEPRVRRELYEVSLQCDEFDAKAGCFVKVLKPFGFRYQTKVTPCK